MSRPRVEEIEEMSTQLPRNLLLLSRIANRGLLLASHYLKRTNVWGMPAHLMIEPTNACNAGCPLCPTGRNALNRPPKMMNLEVFKRIIDEVHPYVHSLCLWNLGEPFLNRQAFDMIRYAHERFIRVTVSTNGWVFYDPDDIPRLLACQLDHLIVSLDGATPETLVQYRVGVDFERVLNGLRRLQVEKRARNTDHPVVEWQFIVMRHNEHEVEQARQLAHEVGATFSLKTVGVPMDSPSAFEQFLPADRAFRRYVRRPDGTYDIEVERRNDCQFLWHSMVINADGRVVPCCYDYYLELIVGDFGQQTVRQIWNGPQLTSLRRRILTDRSRLSPCAQCAVDTLSASFLDNRRTLLHKLRSSRGSARRRRMLAPEPTPPIETPQNVRVTELE